MYPGNRHDSEILNNFLLTILLIMFISEAFSIKSNSKTGHATTRAISHRLPTAAVQV
jgi:hypothetical protein